MIYSFRDYRSYLAAGAYMALGLTAIAAVPLAIGGLLNVAAWARSRPVQVPWVTYGAMWLVIPGSYFFAAFVSASVAFVLKPIRKWILGWIITGAVVAASIYSAVGLAIVAFYDPVGAYVMDNSPREEIVGMMPGLAGVVALVGAIIGIYMWWQDRHGKPFGSAA